MEGNADVIILYMQIAKLQEILESSSVHINTVIPKDVPQILIPCLFLENCNYSLFRLFRKNTVVF